MITREVWIDVVFNFYATPLDYLYAAVQSLLTIPLDLLIFPLEILAIIIYKIVKKE